MSGTPRYGHDPIVMRRVANFEAIEQRGDFFWHVYPDGSRDLCVAIPYEYRTARKDFIYSSWSIGYQNESGASWTWDGNEDAPTLNPSLHAVGFWHGWVQEGVLKES